MDLHDQRRSYERSTLRRADVHADPMQQFSLWFAEAEAERSARTDLADFESHVCSLATVDELGQPSVRIILLKELAGDGFVFYTNLESAKARAIEACPRVALAFHWPWMERQVRIHGSAALVSRERAEAYHRRRPRPSQLSAQCSRQSEVVKDRASLEAAWKEQSDACEGAAVPLPDHWGGFLISPFSLELWQGRPNRLHDRIRYRFDAQDGWTTERLAP